MFREYFTGPKPSLAFLQETAMLTSLLHYPNSRRPMQPLSSTAPQRCPSRGMEGALEREAEAWITQRQVMKKNEKWEGGFFTNIIVIIALLTS